jgi:hypothetical protein
LAELWTKESEMKILEVAEFQRWKEHPLTVEFLALLGKRRLNLMEAWGSGTPLSPEQQSQAVILGQLAQVRHEDVLDMAGVEQGEPVE